MTDPAACPDAENANGLITYKHKFYLHRNLAFTFAQSVQIALKQDGQKSCSESKLCSSLVNGYVNRFNDDIGPNSPIAKIIDAVTKNAPTYLAPYNDELFQAQISSIAKNYKIVSGYTKQDFETKFADSSFKSLDDMLTVYDALNIALNNFKIFYYSTCAMQAKVIPYPCPNNEDMFTLLSSRQVISSYKHHYLFQGVASSAKVCNKHESLTSPFSTQLKSMITNDLSKKGTLGTSITNLYNTENWPDRYEDIQMGIVPFYRNFQEGVTIKDLGTGCFKQGLSNWVYQNWNWSDFNGFISTIDDFNAIYVTACEETQPYERPSSKDLYHFFDLQNALMDVMNLHFALYTTGQIQPLLDVAEEKLGCGWAQLHDIFMESFGTEATNLKDGSFVTQVKKLVSDQKTYPENLQAQIGAIAAASAKLSTYCKPNSECDIFVNAAQLSPFMEDLISKTAIFMNQAFMQKLLVPSVPETKEQPAKKIRPEQQASLTDSDAKKALPKENAKEKSPTATEATAEKAEETKGVEKTESSDPDEIPDCSILDIVEKLFEMTHEKHWLLMSKSKMKESVAPLAAQLKDKKLQGDLKEVQENIEKISKIGLSIGELTLTTGPIGLVFGVFKIFKAAYDIRSTIVDVKKLTDLVCKPKKKEEGDEK